MKNIIIHHEAELELWQAIDYYESRCTGLGLDLEREISRIFVNIQEAPNRWPIKQHDTRYRLLNRFPYAVYYLELQDVIWIVAVAHTSRRPYYWRNRIKLLPSSGE
ncbi:MAG: type II toxin-antitoxin system RelE/ParE family toxin [Nitrospirae bacterium]|nr:type II toxin-antitoxin system RelE/ParE family toxin [Nitrospirota bacterium]